MKRSTTLLGLAAAAVLVAVPQQARADLTYVGSLSQLGGGLGAQLTILTISSPSNSTAESGCVIPGPANVMPGTVASCGYANSNVMTGAGQGGVQLLSNTSLGGLTGSTLRLVFNAAEPGNATGVVLTDLDMYLYNNTTGQVLFSADLPGTLNIGTLTGIGSLSFVFGLTPAQAAAFDAARLAAGSAVLSIGAGMSLTGVSGGPETLNIAVATGSVVPEPSTYLLLGTGLVTLGLAARRRKLG